MIIRVEEHSDLFAEKKTAIANHITTCHPCRKDKLNLDNFEIMKHCNNDFETKIYEALLIEKF